MTGGDGADVVPKGSAGLVAEFLVHTGLYLVIEVSEAAPAFFSVAVLASDHRVSERIDVRSGRLGGRACKLLIHPLLDSRVVLPEATPAFLAITVVTTDDRVS